MVEEKESRQLGWEEEEGDPQWKGVIVFKATSEFCTPWGGRHSQAGHRLAPVSEQSSAGDRVVQEALVKASNKSLPSALHGGHDGRGGQV